MSECSSCIDRGISDITPDHRRPHGGQISLAETSHPLEHLHHLTIIIRECRTSTITLFTPPNGKCFHAGNIQWTTLQIIAGADLLQVPRRTGAGIKFATDGIKYPRRTSALVNI